MKDVTRYPGQSQPPEKVEPGRLGLPMGFEAEGLLPLGSKPVAV